MDTWGEQKWSNYNRYLILSKMLLSYKKNYGYCIKKGMSSVWTTQYSFETIWLKVGVAGKQRVCK